MSAKLRVSLGTSDHANGGERSSPSQVYWDGIDPLLANAGEMSLKVIEPRAEMLGICRLGGNQQEAQKVRARLLLAQNEVVYVHAVPGMNPVSVMH